MGLLIGGNNGLAIPSNRVKGGGTPPEPPAKGLIFHAPYNNDFNDVVQGIEVIYNQAAKIFENNLRLQERSSSVYYEDLRIAMAKSFAIDAYIADTDTDCDIWFFIAGDDTSILGIVCTYDGTGNIVVMMYAVPEIEAEDVNPIINTLVIPVSLNAWHNILCSLNTDTQTVNCYIDRKPIGTVTYELSNTPPFVQSSIENIFSSELISALDNLKMWNYALSAADVAALPNDTPTSAPNPVPPPTPLFHAPYTTDFEDLMGATITEQQDVSIADGMLKFDTITSRLRYTPIEGIAEVCTILFTINAPNPDIATKEVLKFINSTGLGFEIVYTGGGLYLKLGANLIYNIPHNEKVNFAAIINPQFIQIIINGENFGRWSGDPNSANLNMLVLGMDNYSSPENTLISNLQIFNQEILLSEIEQCFLPPIPPLPEGLIFHAPYTENLLDTQGNPIETEDNISIANEMLRLKGTTSVKSYISYNNLAIVNEVTLSFNVMAVKRSNGAVISLLHTTVQTGLCVGITSDSLKFAFQTDMGFMVDINPLDEYMTIEGRFYNICLTIKQTGVNKSIGILINGIPFIQNLTINNPSTLNRVLIGSLPRNSSWGFNQGSDTRMLNLQIYDRILSIEEINEIIALPPTQPDNVLINAPFVDNFDSLTGINSSPSPIDGAVIDNKMLKITNNTLSIGYGVETGDITINAEFINQPDSVGELFTMRTSIESSYIRIEKFAGNKLRASLSSVVTTNYINGQVLIDLPDNEELVQFTYTLHREGNTMFYKFFVNGNKTEGSYTGSSINDYPLGGFYVGRFSAGSTYLGYIGKLKVFNEVLSDDKIAEL